MTACFIRQSPISLGHTGTRDPNFADLICSTLCKRSWICDYDSLVNDRFAAIDHRQRISSICRCWNYKIAFERFSVDGKCAPLCRTLTAGNEQGALRHAEA